MDAIKEAMFAFLPSIVAALLTYYLSKKGQKKGVKGTSKPQPGRHAVYRFFTFFPKYSNCFCYGMFVFAICKIMYSICVRLLDYPKFPLWADILIWAFGTIYLVCSTVGYQLLYMDDSTR